jgi:hypothetical protein
MGRCLILKDWQFCGILHSVDLSTAIDRQVYKCSPNACWSRADDIDSYEINVQSVYFCCDSISRTRVSQLSRQCACSLLRSQQTSADVYFQRITTLTVLTLVIRSRPKIKDGLKQQIVQIQKTELCNRATVHRTIVITTPSLLSTPECYGDNTMVIARFSHSCRQ